MDFSINKFIIKLSDKFIAQSDEICYILRKDGWEKENKKRWGKGGGGGQMVIVEVREGREGRGRKRRKEIKEEEGFKYLTHFVWGLFHAPQRLHE